MSSLGMKGFVMDNNPTLIASAVLIVAGTVMALAYGFMVVTKDTGGPLLLELGGFGAILLGLLLLYVSRSKKA